MSRQRNTSKQTVSVLAALLRSASDWHYGYDLSRATGLKSGTLYPILMRLESSGWLEACWEESATPGRPPRHLYKLTAVGRQEAMSLIGATNRHSAIEALRPGTERGIR